MKLAAYLSAQKLTDAAFAKLVGRDRSTVSRIRTEITRPDWVLIARIQEVTGGLVTANDFVTKSDPETVSKSRRERDRVAS